MWKWSAGLLVAGALVLCWDPSGGGGDDPPPDADPDVVLDRYERAHRVFAALHRDARRETSRMLRAGELATQQEAVARVAADVIAANDAAFRPVAEFEAAKLNDGQWTAELHAAILDGKNGLDDSDE